MNVSVQKTDLETILPFRSLFLQECNFQIRYNACHERNWSDSYFLIVDNVSIGYGSVKGKDNPADRNTVFEFYITPRYRKFSYALFQELLATSRAAFIQCQSNEVHLTSLLFEFADHITSDVILFCDHMEMGHKIPDVIFRHRNSGDEIFEHKSEPVGDYVLAKNGEVVATGGFMLHYNKPFADVYMEVKEQHRGKGLGSFLIQELKKECYLSGRVPAARCNIRNVSSKACLIKSGLKVCGFVLTGEVRGTDS